MRIEYTHAELRSEFSWKYSYDLDVPKFLVTILEMPYNTVATIVLSEEEETLLQTYRLDQQLADSADRARREADRIRRKEERALRKHTGFSEYIPETQDTTGAWVLFFIVASVFALGVVFNG